MDRDGLEGAPGLYVHLPFCVTKCPYCDFYSITDRSRQLELVEAVLSEASSSKKWREGPFETLYLGGGTPSCLELGAIEALVAGLESTFFFTEDRQWTIELNPEDVTGELLRELRRLGFDRVSLGIQSFRDDELQLLGRRHSSRKAIESIQAARAAGFDNISLDLMYGLSVEQTSDRWRESLDRALDFEPEHLSCYMLTLSNQRGSEHTRFELPSEETAADLFRFTSRYLSERGYEHYEVSNFAREKRLRSRHNQKYWRHVPYLGLGPAAHSFDGESRWWNVSSLTDYLARSHRDEPPVAESERLTAEQLQLESLYLGLRTKDGVSMEVVRALEGWERVVAELVSEGLIQEASEERLAPTLQGLLMSDGLPLRFFSES